MKNFFKKSWAWLAAALMVVGAIVISFWPSQQSQTYLYLLYDGARAGEKSQVLGVANSLKEHLPKDTIRKEFELKDKDKFLADVRGNLKEQSNDKGIILAAEVGSMDILKQLKLQSNIVMAHSSHQYTKNHASLKDIADIVALPQYVVTDEVHKAIESPHTILISTTGVPHNVSPETITEAYQQNKDSLPPAERYIGIILGGDAETPEGKVRYYTAQEAMELASYIVPQVKKEKAHLLILNGPRTGKHDQKTGKLIETSHRDGSVDAITMAFIESLQAQGLNQGPDFTLLDFQFGKPSAYPVVLGALYATKSPIFVAGESTSMVSEAADCLPHDLVTAYTNGAMNENHKKHCVSENETGRINILENNGGKWQLLKARDIRDPESSRSASQIIAESIKKRFEEKWHQ